DDEVGQRRGAAGQELAGRDLLRADPARMIHLDLTADQPGLAGSAHTLGTGGGDGQSRLVGGLEDRGARLTDDRPAAGAEVDGMRSSRLLPRGPGQPVRGCGGEDE